MRGFDIAITSWAGSIFNRFALFLSSKSICDVVFGAITSILVKKNKLERSSACRNRYIFAKSYFSEELFAFW